MLVAVLDEFIRRKLCGGELLEKIKNVAPPQVIVEMALGSGIEKILQKSRRGIFLGQCLQELLGRLADNEILCQCFPQRDGLAVGIGDLLIA